MEETKITSSSKTPNNNFFKFTLIAILFFIFAFCCLGVIGFLVFEGVFTSIFSNIEWNVLEGYASLITMSLVIGGLAFAFADWVQKEEAERQEKHKIAYRHFETIHDRLTAPEQEQARRWIYENIPVMAKDQPLEDWLTGVQKAVDAKPKGWTEERTPGQQHLKSVLNCFDFIGFVVNKYWTAENKEIEWFSPPIAKVWQRIGPYIQHQREIRKEPDYYKEASWLGEYTIQWRKEAGYQEPEIVEDSV